MSIFYKLVYHSFTRYYHILQVTHASFPRLDRKTNDAALQSGSPSMPEVWCAPGKIHLRCGDETQADSRSRC